MESVYAPFQTGVQLCLMIIAVSMVLTVIRLVRGPETPDRTVSFDLLAVQAVAVVLVVSILLGRSDIYDVAIVTAVLGFLGTVLLSRFLEGGG